MYVKKFTSFRQVLKEAHKRKLVPFFCLTVYIDIEIDTHAWHTEAANVCDGSFRRRVFGGRGWCLGANVRYHGLHTLAFMVREPTASRLFCGACAPPPSLRHSRNYTSAHLSVSAVVFIYIFIRINCSFKNKKFKKKTKEKDTNNVSKNTTCQMHTNYAQWKRKVTYTLKIDDTVTNRVAHVIN